MTQSKIQHKTQYEITLTFHDGETFQLKGTAKTEASYMVKHPRTMKAIFKKLGLGSESAIQSFREKTYEKLTLSENSKTHAEYSIHDINSNDLLVKVQCRTL